DVAESVTFYRKTLSAQNDHSVTILSLGFGTTLACLLDSDPDAYSALSGRELVAQKVCLLAIMAGSFGENMRAEFNVVNDRSSMQQLFATWNTPIVLAPFELGKKVQYPASAIENSFGWTSLHPVVEGYKCYCQMPYDRATWDLMPFIWLLHPDFFTTSDAGKITIDDNGYTHFTPDASSNHVWLDATPTQAEVLKAYILAESTRPPHKYAR
ncbi:MAG: nucleoside hydrolase, partial [Alistipes sp.]